MIGRELAHENGTKKNSHRGTSAIETSGPNENVESKKEIYRILIDDGTNTTSSLIGSTEAEALYLDCHDSQWR